jgi:hypothetical protein
VSAPDVFDELLSLRRLEVALKRGDERMFQQGLERLGAEVLARQPFKHHHAWQNLLASATESDRLPEALKESLREAIARLIAVEARVAPAAPAAEEAMPAEAGGQAIALVLGWHSSLRDESLRNNFLAWLGRAGQTASATLLERWLRDGLSLEQLLNRANLTLAAAHAGVVTHEAPWVDTLLAGLAQVLAAPSAPPITRLIEAIAPLGPVSVLTVEPSLSWERFYGPASFRRSSEGAGRVALAKLAGSVDRFYCHACYQTTEVPEGSGPRALVLACSQCGAPARPLLVPANSPHFFPAALREQWAWGAELLRGAATWVLVAPGAPTGDAFERWLASGLDAEKRVVVLAEDDAVLKGWQEALGERAGTVVTSHGSPDEVLAFLLQGGVPELSTPAARPAAPAFAKKKPKR